MARLIASLTPQAGALAISGGDMACAVLRALQACAIEIHEEVAPGVPASCIIGGVADGIPLITKSGGFGDPDTLLHTLRYLKGYSVRKRIDKPPMHAD